MAAPDDFEAWFRLLETPRLGAAQARQVLATFGSPEAALGASPATLRSCLPEALAKVLAGPAPENFSERLQRCRQWFDGGPGRGFLTLGDAAYAPLLLQTADPPLLLYTEGDVGRLAAPSLAVVGSRNPTPQGEDNARAFAAALSRAGLTVVSGLARGIDAAAHEGGLKGEANTIAVLGTGPDEPYPRRNAGLAARIVAGGGLIVSEYAPGTPPLTANFPRRNRVIAGLSLGTLVVEAAVRSGSLITARLASEAGREVFAIPGSIHSPTSKGCHALIKQGAKLVEVAADILEELRFGGAKAALGSAAPGLQSGLQSGVEDEAVDDDAPVASEDSLLRALGHDPMTLDALQARTGWPTGELAARLLDLELEGRITRLPGGLFQRHGQG
jgi:DNA processing protein